MVTLKKIPFLSNGILTTLEKEATPQERAIFTGLRTQSQSFDLPGEGFFAVEVANQIIGMGSIQQSPDAPPTAGIALLSNCYISPSERRKGYGTQLYKQLVQFAKIHFNLLQLGADCPLKYRKGDLIDLATEG